MVAITTAGVHSAGLHRLGCHPEWQGKLRETLGRPLDHDPERWRPRVLQPVMWQTPGMMLKLAITCFLVGLLILVWNTARRFDTVWENDDTKVSGSTIGIQGFCLIGLQLDCYSLYNRRWCFIDSICNVCIWTVLQDSGIASCKGDYLVNGRLVIRELYFSHVTLFPTRHFLPQLTGDVLCVSGSVYQGRYERVRTIRRVVPQGSCHGENMGADCTPYSA